MATSWHRSCNASRVCLLGEWLLFLLFSKSLVVRVSVILCKLLFYKIKLAYIIELIYFNRTDKPKGSRKSPLLNRYPTSVKAGGVSLSIGINIQKRTVL